MANRQGGHITIVVDPSKTIQVEGKAVDSLRVNISTGKMAALSGGIEVVSGINLAPGVSQISYQVNDCDDSAEISRVTAKF